MAFSTMFFLSATNSEYCAFDVESGEYAGEYCTLDDSFEKVYRLFFGTLEADGEFIGSHRCILVSSTFFTTS